MLEENMYPLKTKTKLNNSILGLHHLKQHVNDYNNLVEKDFENININSNPSI